MLTHACLQFSRRYVPFLADIFNIVPLSWEEWQLVLLWSLPVVLMDEILKVVARLFFRWVSFCVYVFFVPCVSVCLLSDLSIVQLTVQLILHSAQERHQDREGKEGVEILEVCLH